jgi:hypothetical protein
LSDAIGSAAPLLSPETTAAALTYEDANGNPVGVASAKIISVTLSTKPEVFAGGDVVLSTDIELRNLQ